MAAGGIATYQDVTLAELAGVIDADWSGQGKGVNYAAKPYLEALYCVNTLDDSYGCDSAKSVVAYFLANAGTWRGETAKAVKAELKARLKKAGW